MTETSGPAGIARAAAGNPDIILLDVAMPGMSGWDVARSLRQDLARRVPVIIISAYMPENGRIAQAAADHEAYLIKPVRIERLLDTIRKLLNLEWISRARPAQDSSQAPFAGEIPPASRLEELHHLGRIGHLHGILAKLDEIGAAQPGAAPTLAYLRRLAENCDLAGYRAALETLTGHGS